MQHAPSDDDRRPQAAWTDRMRAVFRVAVRVHVMVGAQGVGVMSQVLMQGLVL